MKAPDVSPDLISYTPEQAGRVSQLGLAAINKAIEDGDLKFIWKPPGMRYKLIRRAELDRYLESIQPRV